MRFADKLVFLIKLTNSTNKKLADAVNLDPSQISRLRCGVRELPRGAEYLPAMAAYFVALCQNDYQLMALSEQINGKPLDLPADRALLAEELFFWLTREESAPLPHAGDRYKYYQAGRGDDQQPASTVQSHSVKTFYDREGQRKALSLLLETTLRRGRPTLLQFYSDQELAWQEENDYHQNILPKQLLELLRIGCRFQRILRPDVDLHYAFTSVKLWLPVYLEGGVETFFCPRLRDMVYRRTLVVVQQVGAIVSTSIGAQSEGRVSHLFTEGPLVEHYSREFKDYLMICQKIDNKYKNKNVEDYISDIMDRAARNDMHITIEKDGFGTTRQR